MVRTPTPRWPRTNGASLIPWGINRAIRRVTGRTYEQLYQGWQADLERKYQAQTQAVLARGLRQGRRLTRPRVQRGDPRFSCPVAANAAGRAWSYARDDGNTTPGIYALELDAPDPDASAELIARSSGHGVAVDRDCSLYFDSSAPSNRLYFFNDLFRQPANTRSPAGTERNRKRLTVGARAGTPDVSPDGTLAQLRDQPRGHEHAAHRAHRRPTRARRRARAGAERRIRAGVYAALLSDGKQVAYSAWTRGGYRDIRIVDARSGSFYEVTHDRAIDQQPTWSPDGKDALFRVGQDGDRQCVRVRSSAPQSCRK